MCVGAHGWEDCRTITSVLRDRVSAEMRNTTGFYKGRTVEFEHAINGVGELLDLMVAW